MHNFESGPIDVNFANAVNHSRTPQVSILQEGRDCGKQNS